MFRSGAQLIKPNGVAVLQKPRGKLIDFDD